MAVPRRPPGGRSARSPAGRRTGRPAARTVTSARTGASAADGRPSSVRRPQERTGNRAPSQLTRRALVLVVVIVGGLISAFFPLQHHLAQRAEIRTLEESRSSAQARVTALEQERQRLLDPAFVAAEARRRLHFVLPGETAYVLVDPPPPVVAAADPDAPPGPDAPWFTQVWGSVREADRPTAP